MGYYRPKKVHARPKLGYGNKSNLELSLDEVVKILTTEIEVGEIIPSILIVHDRGLSGGDEARLTKLGVDINDKFWHVVDTQTLAGALSPLPPGQKWSLERMVRELCHFEPMTTQKALKTASPGQVIHHNAQDDAWVTLFAFIYMVQQRASALGLTQAKGPRVQLVSLDFEGGGGPTTEMGFALIDLWHINDVAPAVLTRHFIVAEHRNLHPCRAAQNGKMQLDDRKQDTYPRWNTRSGPHGCKKVLTTIDSDVYLCSPDSLFIPIKHIGSSFNSYISPSWQKDAFQDALSFQRPPKESKKPVPFRW